MKENLVILFWFSFYSLFSAWKIVPHASLHLSIKVVVDRFYIGRYRQCSFGYRGFVCCTSRDMKMRCVVSRCTISSAQQIAWRKEWRLPTSAWTAQCRCSSLWRSWTTTSTSMRKAVNRYGLAYMYQWTGVPEGCLAHIYSGQVYLRVAWLTHTSEQVYLRVAWFTCTCERVYLRVAWLTCTCGQVYLRVAWLTHTCGQLYGTWGLPGSHVPVDRYT